MRSCTATRGDPFARATGRVRVAPEDQPPIPNGSRPGYVYQPHEHGVGLVGWKIKATFPTGPTRELRWHDGFVMSCSELTAGDSTTYRYVLFFPIDATDEVVSTPFNDKALCFRKAHLADPKAEMSEREVTQARARRWVVRLRAGGGA